MNADFWTPANASFKIHFTRLFVIPVRHRHNSTTEIMAPSILDTQPLAEISSKTEAMNAQNGFIKHEEYQYLDLIREILETGEHRPDRYFNPGLS